MNNKKDEKTSVTKKGLFVGIGCLVLFLPVLIFIIAAIVKSSDDVSDYKEKYTYQDTQKFERKKDSINFHEYKKELL